MHTDWVADRRDRVDEFRRRHRIGLVTLFFSDIVGSTAVKNALGDARAVPLIERHHQTYRQLLTQFPEGEEIGTAGDSFFIVFTKPSDAVRFGLLVQRANRPKSKDEPPLRDRIGIHVGEVFIDDDPAGPRSRDLYGLQVDTCARIMSLGDADQILLSRFAFDSARQVLKGDDVASVGGLSWLNHGTYVLKGVDDPLEVCEVGERGEAGLTPPPDSSKGRREVRSGDEPVLGWRPAINQTVPNTEWVLEKSLGEGGFGEVWLGHNRTLKQRRVFKFCFDPDRVRSLKREVTIFRILKENVGTHPNIVSIEDVYFEQPPFYIVFEYVDGPNLRDWWNEQAPGADADFGKRLEIVAQTADALQTAHDAGVIHRDVKPQNILIARDEQTVRAKLTDFGIGKLVSEQALLGMTRLGFTQTMGSSESHTGTQMYMAPEILGGQPATTRSDIYSLGVVLYQLIVGDLTRPLTSEWETDVADPLLRDDLRHCFARDPEKRFAAAKQLGDNLRSLKQRRQAFELEQNVQAAREKAAYHRGILRSAAVAVVVIALVFGLAVLAWKQARRARSAQTETRETLSRSDFLQGVHFLEADDVSLAMAYFARAVRQDGNPAAATRIVRLLMERNWARPVGQPIQQPHATSAAISSNSELIATAGSDGVLRLSKIKTGETVATLKGHTAAINSVEFSANGSHLLTSSKDQTARIWSTAPPAAGPILTHRGNVRMAQFNPKGDLIVTASADGTARIWTLDGKPQGVPLDMYAEVNSARFSPDGSKIVTAGYSNDRGDGYARIWDAQTGNPLTAYMLMEDRVDNASFSPNGAFVVVSGESPHHLASLTGNVQVFDAVAATHAGDEISGEGNTLEASFSPEGGRLLTVFESGVFQKGGMFLLDADTHLQVFDRVPNASRAMFSPDGLMIFTDETCVRDARNGKTIMQRVAGKLSSVSPDGHYLAVIGEDRESVEVWKIEVTAAGLTRTDPTLTPREIQKTPLAGLSPQADEAFFVTGDYSQKEDTVAFVNSKTGQHRPPDLRHPDRIVHAEYSRDGRRFLTASSDGMARVWDTKSGKILSELKQAGLHLAAFDSAAKRVATAGGSGDAGFLCVWDASTGKLLAQSQSEHFTILTVAFSSTGDAIVVAGTLPSLGDKPQQEPYIARVYDPKNCSVIAKFEPPPSPSTPAIKRIKRGDWFIENELFENSDDTILLEPPTYEAEFSPDGTLVVSSWEGCPVWDARTGEVKAKFSVGRPVSAHFSPDGLHILTTCDGRLTVWQLESHEPVFAPLEHPVRTKATFSSDGSRVIAWLDDVSGERTVPQRVEVWDSATGKALSTSFPSFRALGDSADGKQLLLAGPQPGPPPAFVDLAPLRAPPAWLADLAEVAGGFRLNANGIPEAIPHIVDRWRHLITHGADKARLSDPWNPVREWFLAEVEQRRASPFSDQASDRKYMRLVDDQVDAMEFGNQNDFSADGKTITYEDEIASLARLNATPNDPDALLKRIEALQLAAAYRTHHSAAALAEAFGLVNRGLAIAPSRWQLWEASGDLLLDETRGTPDHAEALKSYQRGLSTAPRDNREVIAKLAMAVADESDALGHSADAVAAWKQTLEATRDALKEKGGLKDTALERHIDRSRRHYENVLAQLHRQGEVDQLVKDLAVIWFKSEGGPLLQPPELLPRKVKDGVLFQCYAPFASAVYLAGDFNNWANNVNSVISDPDCALAGPDAKGIWKKTVSLPPGHYKFRLNINGTVWFTPDQIADQDQDGNGLFTVKPDGTVEIKTY